MKLDCLVIAAHPDDAEISVGGTLLKLAAAQIHEKRWDGAGESVDKLLTRHWPSRFGNVHNQARNLKGHIEKGRKIEAL